MKLLKQFLLNLYSNYYSGEFKSKVKGNGYDLEEIRQYVPGDKFNNINWKLSAKYDDLFTNIYRQEKDIILDVIIDNNLNLKFFDEIFEKIKTTILQLSREFGFRYRVFTFNKKQNLVQIPDFSFSFNKFNRAILNNLNKNSAKIIISDFLFLDVELVNNTYFGVLPIRKFFKGKYFPVLNGYFFSTDDFWKNYESKLKKFQLYGVLEDL